ncbi:hypothetical protein C8034_v004685 [Colletotrichum sidae]|uniref:Aspercryptin biosynthesis cluster-specific transcription regulator atnN n=1 Tax=Colletotrichum sidae TaxID=1347389 RepID=A0A4R8T884_9PEZI|nr:hypothetical protein C8034_v004685 [Colletotrichum sidae]
MNWSIAGTDTERLMFHHVHSCTVRDFGLASPLAKLWSNYILPLGYYSDSVKHAVVALGVAHRGFLENPSYDTPAPPVPSLAAEGLSFDDLATKQYRRAVSEAIQIMAEPTPVNVRITLICCLVFVCYEIIRGQYDKAIQHLKAGSKVMESLHQAALAYRRDPLSLSPYDQCLAETVNSHFGQLCEIASMFSCMGMDASMLVEDAIVPDLSFFVQPEAAGKDKPITSVAEARYQLHLAEVKFAEAYDDNFASTGSYESASSGSENSSPAQRQSNPAEQPRGPMWDEAVRQFESWSARFDAFQETLPGVTSPEDSQELQALRFSKRSWEVFNSYAAPAAMKDADKAELIEVIDMAEELVFPRDSAPRPTFALGADIVPSMSYICAFCEDDEMELRIIALLRKMRRREGMWDSREMANLYDFILQSKWNKTWKDEYNWESLPALARRMADLSISGRERSAAPSPLTLL